MLETLVLGQSFNIYLLFEHFPAKRQPAIEHGCVTRSSTSRTWIVMAGSSVDKPDSTTPEVKINI